MPESPEVKLTTDYLSSKMENKIIVGWNFLSEDWLKKKLSVYNDFCKALPLLVEEVSCKGKLIYFILYNEFQKFYITHSLRLTGKWKDQKEQKDKSCKWVVTLNNNKSLYFFDLKGFGTLNFFHHKHNLEEALKSLGPDILSENFKLTLWKALIKKYKNKNITSFLMDQSIISGCGNYIKAESLYYARISPKRKTGTLTEREMEVLFEALKIISRISYNYGGLYDDKGGYRDKLKIYGKDWATREKTTDGRTTYWDPNVQV